MNKVAGTIKISDSRCLGKKFTFLKKVYEIKVAFGEEVIFSILEINEEFFVDIINSEQKEQDKNSLSFNRIMLVKV